MIKTYEPNKKLSFEEIEEKFPDVYNQITNLNTWNQYEQQPDFSEIDPIFNKWIPQTVKDGKCDERIDSIIIK